MTTAKHPSHGKRKSVPIDEPRERAGEIPGAFSIETPDGVDDVGEEMGESFVRNATGADDASMELREEETLEDEGGPFVVTTGAVEFAKGTDASNPADAEREALPTVSVAPARHNDGTAPSR